MTPSSDNDTASMQARHIIVSGKVQGVSYRAWTVMTARKQGIKGWVRNLANGDVEIMAYGGNAALDQFIDTLYDGSAAADVAHVKARRVEFDPEDVHYFQQVLTADQPVKS